jgi:ferrous iron transport protein A
MTLDAIPQKTRALVVSVDTSGTGGLRLMEMGIIPGASLHVVKSAPLGDPIQISLRGSHLAVRRAEARAIHVMLCEE